MINRGLLRYLCCPQCKSDLLEENNFLVCEKCKKKYGIRKGIPVLVDLETLPKHLQRQIRYFEKKVRPEYRLGEWQKSYLRRLGENLQFKKSEILIDVGTGSGHIAVEMAKKGQKVIACDLTLKELIQLEDVVSKEGLEDNLFLVCCTAEDLSLKSKIADYLVCNAVLEHLLREKKAAAEVSRVCKHRSGIMVTVPLKLRHLSPLLWLPTCIHDKRIGHLRRYDEKILSARFGSFGYKTKKVYYPGHFEKALVTSLSILGIHKPKWEKWCEARDKRKEHKKYGATNICVILER